MKPTRRMKLSAMLLAAALCVAALCLCLIRMQGALTMRSQQENTAQKMQMMEALTASARETAHSTQAMFDGIYRSKASTLAYLIAGDAEQTPDQAQMEEYRSILNVTNVLVIGPAGRPLAAAQPAHADFTRMRYNQLRTPFDTQRPSEPFTVEEEGGSLRYYGAPIDAQRMAVVVLDPQELAQLMRDTGSWAGILGNVRLGLGGYAFAVSARDYTILYHPDEALAGKDALAAGIGVAQLEDGAFDLISVNGERFYAGVAKVEDVYILCAVPESELVSSGRTTIVLITAIFLIVILSVIAYAFFLDEANAGADSLRPIGHGWFVNRIVARKLLTVSGIGLALLFAASLYLQTLFTLSEQSVSNRQRLAEVEETMARYEADVALLQERYNRSYLSKAEAAAYVLTRHPELATRKGLSGLCEALEAQSVNVFDETGTMTATSSGYSNFSLSYDPNDQSYAFRQLLQGVESLVQPAQPDDISGRYLQYIGVTLRDEDGDADGFVQIAMEPEQLAHALANLNLAAVLRGVRTGRGGFAFAVDKETLTFSYHPEEKFIGASALDHGLTQAQLRDGFSDYLTLDYTRCFAASLETRTDILFVAVPASALGQGRLAVSAVTAGIGCVCLLLLCLLLCVNRGAATEEEAVPEDNPQMVDVHMPDGSIKKTESAVSRFDHTVISWRNRTPEQRLFSVIGVMLTVLAALICLGTAVYGQAESSVLRYVLSGRWTRSVNIFSLTASLMVICAVSVASMLLQRLLMLMARVFDAHTATVCRLLVNLVRYVSVIAELYYCFALFGVDTATLLASAGILTLVIGLGAKELVSDILAGLFIIFEGEFRVGDIVTIGDCRGTVLEIGVRTTKIEIPGKNIKIFNNSSISGVINMTRQHSFASCTVGIEYGESLERVEEVLARELPLMRERLPAIKDGPFYKGVKELGASSVDIMILALCAEGDRIQLCRDLNREIKLIFDRNNINIPFPQVVLNYREENEQP